MVHVDLQRRRERLGRSRRGHTGIGYDAGFAAGLLRTVVSLSPPAALLFTLLVAPVFMGPSAVSLLLALVAPSLVFLLLLPPGEWSSGPRAAVDPGSHPGSEKQLLLALRDLGGLTVVEAALETSLTVDEAEELLTHLADRGHLSVEGRDGALVYALPGRPV